MKLTTIEPVIAERTLTLAPRDKVVVRVGKPRKMRGFPDYYCPFEILWPDRRRIFYSCGIDSMQALKLTLETIATDLYTQPVAARLKWLGMRDLGFPVSDLVAALVPKDKPRRPPSRKKAAKVR